MCFGKTVFLCPYISAKLKAARRERERVISEHSTREIGSVPPSCPTQAWSEGAEKKRKSDQMQPFKGPSLKHQKRSDVCKPVAHLPEKVSQ